MTTLKDRIRDLIRFDGPMPVSTYMMTCLHDPRHGYYATRPGLGRDFSTSPEISQVFGELLGLWAAHEWAAMGSPNPFWLVELGPGRGVMMADALRAASAAPGFLDAARIALVEASAPLIEEQSRRLANHPVAHFASLDAIPEGPAIILANEFLDCMAVRQYVRDGNSWRERVVGLGENDALQIGLGGLAEPPANVLPVGESLEVASALAPFIESLARRFRQSPGRALFIDYGPDDRSPGDTLRAYSNGLQVDPFADPGVADLTADVDFPRIRRIAEAEGMAAFGPAQQGHFLIRLGAQVRARALCESNPSRADEISAAVLRLLSTDDMGSRFKAICLAPLRTPIPPGF